MAYFDNPSTVLRFVSRMTFEPPIGVGTRELLAQAMADTGEEWIVVCAPVLTRDWQEKISRVVGTKPQPVHFLSETRIAHSRRPTRALDPVFMNPDTNVLVDCANCMRSDYRGVVWHALNTFLLNRRRVWIRK